MTRDVMPLPQAASGALGLLLTVLLALSTAGCQGSSAPPATAGEALGGGASAPAPEATAVVPTAFGAVMYDLSGPRPEVAARVDIGVASRDAALGPGGLVWIAAPFLPDGTASRSLIGVEPASGEVVKRIPLPPSLRRPTGLAAADGRLYVRSDRDGRSVGVGVLEGGGVRLLAELETTGGAFDGGLEYVGGRLYTFSAWTGEADEHRIHAIDPASGEVLGQLPAAGYYAVVGTTAYVTSRTEEGAALSAVDLPSMRVTRTAEVPDLPLVAATDSLVYLAHWDGGAVSVFDPALDPTGQHWLPKLPTGGVAAVDGFRALGAGWLLLNPTSGALLPTP